MGCTTVQERYSPVVVAADSTTVIEQQSIGGFICTGDGTVSVLDYYGKYLVNALPVTAGIYYPIPIYLGEYGGSFVTVGATGTLCK